MVERFGLIRTRIKPDAHIPQSLLEAEKQTAAAGGDVLFEEGDLLTSGSCAHTRTRTHTHTRTLSFEGKGGTLGAWLGHVSCLRGKPSPQTSILAPDVWWRELGRGQGGVVPGWGRGHRLSGSEGFSGMRTPPLPPSSGGRGAASSVLPDC